MSTAIVTGAAGAIGTAIAERLVDDGWAVMCVDRSEALDALCRHLEQRGGIAKPCAVDLADEHASEKILDAAARFGDPGVLVNNAGITRDARLQEMDEDDFREVVRVNAVAPLRLAHVISPHLQRGSAIINVASRAALGNFGQANYVASKAALIGGTRAMALQWAPRLRVNAVAPGLVDTPMTQAMPREVLDKLFARIPVGRAAEPAEIAEVVAFLASQRSSYITGQVLLACGGRSLVA